MNKELLESILEQLQLHRQAATYDAVAALVDSTALHVMKDYDRTARNSWVINKKSKRPTDYADQQLDPELLPSIAAKGIITTSDELKQWLENRRELIKLFPLDPESPPLRLDEGETVRIGQSRITLDLVVQQYENGMTPEEIVRAYDTLLLADVYGAIAYYLRHRDTVATYLQRREQEAKALQAMIETEGPRITREELLARRGAMEEYHAPTSK
jgi:uncharacterized protein (DUF433 family)